VNKKENTTKKELPKE